MRSSTKSELQALRELAWWILPQLRCCFCFKPILEDQDGVTTFGHRRHAPIDVEFTIHHRDHNRENNTKGNLAICHPDCHRKYHVEVNRATRSARTSIPSS